MFAEKLIKTIMELYCIKTHSKKIVIEGLMYTAIDENKRGCNCNNCYDVGIRLSNFRIGQMVTCIDCGIVRPYDGIAWISKKLFIPIDSINIEEAIECLNETELINS